MPESDAIRHQLHRGVDLFRQHFGRAAQFAAAAPGRVNLIGEHTDYSGGFVLPMALERQTLVLAARRDPAGTSSRLVRVRTTDEKARHEPAEFVADSHLAPGHPPWANYVKGVIAGCLAAGLDPCVSDGRPAGFDMLVDSTIPLGGGLSSSASLEVAVATLLEAMTGKALEPIAKALLCQKAEHEFAKVPCGLMDQFISVMGRADHAMLLDCQSQTPKLVPLSDPNVTVLIANTNVKRHLASGKYKQRRDECERAAKILGVPSLRHATLRDVLGRQAALDPVAFLRARHVVGENERTQSAANAMAGGDYTTVGRLMYDSHASLRDDFDVSCDELNTMVNLVRELGASSRGGAVLGARMTGGGFGGCVVALVRSDQAEAIAHRLHALYQEQTGTEPTIFTSRAAAGARTLPVNA